MEVVIEIPDDAYKKLCSCGYVSSNLNIISAIKSGIPLPEHHGDLKDTSTFKYNDCAEPAVTCIKDISCSECCYCAITKSTIDHLPTIIPATCTGR